MIWPFLPPKYRGAPTQRAAAALFLLAPLLVVLLQVWFGPDVSLVTARAILSLEVLGIIALFVVAAFQAWRADWPEQPTLSPEQVKRGLVWRRGWGCFCIAGAVLYCAIYVSHPAEVHMLVHSIVLALIAAPLIVRPDLGLVRGEQRIDAVKLAAAFFAIVVTSAFGEALLKPFVSDGYFRPLELGVAFAMLALVLWYYSRLFRRRVPT